MTPVKRATRPTGGTNLREIPREEFRFLECNLPGAAACLDVGCGDGQSI